MHKRSDLTARGKTPAISGPAPQGHGTDSGVECGGHAAVVQVDAAKVKSTVFAKAALVKLEVYEMADGSFIVSRWGFFKPAADLAGVMRMVRQMGGST